MKTAYEKLLEMKNNERNDYFVMILSYFFDIGYDQASKITDKDIENAESNGLMAKEFAQKLMTSARQIANITESAIDVVQFCMVEDIFDTESYANKLPRYKLEDMLKYRISCESKNPSDTNAADYFEDKYGCDINDFEMLGYAIEE